MFLKKVENVKVLSLTLIKQDQNFSTCTHKKNKISTEVNACFSFQRYLPPFFDIIELEQPYTEEWGVLWNSRSFSLSISVGGRSHWGWNQVKLKVPNFEGCPFLFGWERREHLFESFRTDLFTLRVLLIIVGVGAAAVVPEGTLFQCWKTCKRSTWLESSPFIIINEWCGLVHGRRCQIDS